MTTSPPTIRLYGAFVGASASLEGSFSPVESLVAPAGVEGADVVVFFWVSLLSRDLPRPVFARAVRPHGNSSGHM